MMKKLYAIALIVGLSTMQALPAREARAAETDHGLPEIFISEINWAGSTLSNADEWLEIANRSGESVDLSGWVLAGAATSGEALAIADGFVIAPGGIALISNYPFGNEKTTLAVEPSLVTASLSLSNSALEIMLAMPDGTVVDEVLKGEQVGSSNPFVSMTRNADGSWRETTESVNLLNSAQMGTPGVHDFSATVPNTEDPVDEPIASEEDPDVIEEHVDEEPVDEPVEVEERETIVVCTTVYADTGEQVSPTDDAASEETLAPEPEVEEPDSSEPEPETEPVQDDEPETAPADETENDLQIDGALSGDVRINEIVSDPTDGVEWVELFNFGVKTVSMDGWSIADESGKLTKIVGVSLAPGAFHVIDNPAGKLNNDKDSVLLYGAAGDLVDKMSYGITGIKAPKKGESLIYMNKSWVVTDNITKGAANALPSEEKIDEARDALPTEPDALQETSASDGGVGGANPSDVKKETKVIAIAEQTPAKTSTTSSTKTSTTTSSASKTKDVATGVVTAEPGLFGKQLAFIDGIQLYFHSADWPTLTVGDVVKVTGERSVSRGEPRIKIASADDIEITGRADVQGKPTNASAVSAAQEGALVTLTGAVIERNGDKIVLRDETGEATVVAHANTGVSLASLEGGTLSVTGIVRIFEDGVRVYLRSQADIQVATVVAEEETVSQNDTALPIARTQSSTPWIGGGVVATAAATMLFWYIQHRKSLRASVRALAT